MPTAHLSLAQLWQINIQPCALISPDDSEDVDVCGFPCNVQGRDSIAKALRTKQERKMLQDPLRCIQLSSAMAGYK